MGGTPPAEPPPPPAAPPGTPTTEAPSLSNWGTPSSGGPPALRGLTSTRGPPASHQPGGPAPHTKSKDPGVPTSNSWESPGTSQPGATPAAAGNHLTPSSRGSRVTEKAAMDSWLKQLYGASVRHTSFISLEVIHGNWLKTAPSLAKGYASVGDRPSGNPPHPSLARAIQRLDGTRPTPS